MKQPPLEDKDEEEALYTLDVKGGDTKLNAREDVVEEKKMADNTRNDAPME